MDIVREFQARNSFKMTSKFFKFAFGTENVLKTYLLRGLIGLHLNETKGEKRKRERERERESE